MTDGKVAVLGGGCFWCLDAVFSRVEGVENVECGYAGGSLPNPDYEAVCTGETGHAEVCRITYDPGRVSFEDLLEIFFRIHDPTTRNRQGADVGSQYRSLILAVDEDQLRRAKKVREEIEAAGVYPAPLVTEIRPLRRFWPAEPHHQDYYARNPEAGYCRAVIAPKVEKLEKVFHDKLKPSRR